MLSTQRSLPFHTITASVAALVAVAVLTASVPAFADTSVKDAKIGTYVRWGGDKVNLRLDNVERVEHIDARPIASGQNLSDPTNGYTIFSISLQNAGESGSARPIGVTAIFDDESEIDSHSDGPFIGSGRAYFNAHLEHLQMVHVRMIQMNTPADRKITKIIFDPNDGSPKLRFTVKNDQISRVPEIPLASASH